MHESRRGFGHGRFRDVLKRRRAVPSWFRQRRPRLYAVEFPGVVTRRS